MFEGWGAAAVAVAAVGTAVSSSQAEDAEDAQYAANQQANQTQLDQYRQNRIDATPWREAGEDALSQLAAGTKPDGEYMRDFGLADFVKDPGYDFRMQEGQRAVDASAAARGGALSGAAIKGSERYGQNFASGEYQNAYNRFNADRTQRFNRLSSLAGTGQTATRDVASQGTQVATNIANNQIGLGNVQAASSIAQGNNIQSGMNTLGNWYMQRQMQQPQQQANTQPVSGGGTMWDGNSYGGGDTLYG